MTSKTVIALQSVDLIYAGGAAPLKALENVSLEARSGEFVAIVGPSGCGKSTIIKIIAGLINISTGRASINGHPISGPPPDVGIVFQSPLLMPWLTVRRNVLVQIDMRGLPIGRYEAVASALLQLVGLADFAEAYPHQLSGGMQQRVGICRALVHAPTLLMMDEPFGALDAMAREQMMIELQKIWLDRKITVLFITHSIVEAVFLADRVLVMGPRPGRVIGDYAIDLPRPRRIKDLGAGQFGRLTSEIRDCLERAGAPAI